MEGSVYLSYVVIVHKKFDGRVCVFVLCSDCYVLQSQYDLCFKSDTSRWKALRTKNTIIPLSKIFDRMMVKWF